MTFGRVRPAGRRLAGTAVVAASLVGAAALSTSPALTASGAAATTRHGVTPAVGVTPYAIPAGTMEPGGSVKFSCQTGSSKSGLFCYGPDQIRAAYSIQPLLDKGITGKGRSIVIVDAYAPPTVASDLKSFDTAWGLPDAQLQIVNPYGAGFDASDPNQVSWSSEIALDTQWAHAVAPDAKIVLVEAKTNNDPDILAATQYAVDHNLGDVISQSFGEDERCVDPALLKAEHALFAKATAKGITLIASAGDQGAAQPTCDGSSYSLAVSSPASDPLVLGVGGTSLFADPVTGAYQSETVWNESAKFGAAGGGGYSVLYHRPDYQEGAVRNRGRGVPDVAYDGGIDHGVLVFWGQGGGFYIFGGTSSGSPQWAGLVALGAQLGHHRLGFVNDSIYAIGRTRAASTVLHDVTVGDNTFTGTDVNNNPVSVTGYPATKGWDATTGYGTPIASKLLPFLALTSGFGRH